MFKCFPIKNFLLLKYKREELISPKNHNYTDQDKSIYLECQDALFYRAVEQINFFHPKSHIHVLTNEKLPPLKNTSYCVFNENWTNMICKFKLYSLIDEPAMYVDLDVVFNYPLPSMQEYQEYPFYFFNVSWGENIQNYTQKNLPANHNIVYNSGVTWINKPSKELTDQLLDLQEFYFNDTNMILSKNLWAYNDEHALSLLTSIKNYKMPISSTINVSRNKLNKNLEKKTIKDFQSIHYTGVTTKQKMIEEYCLYNIFKYHFNEKVKNYFKINDNI